MSTETPVKLEKLTIKSIDKPTAEFTVIAQYNPKELQIDQNVPWKKPDAATQEGSQKAKAADEDPIALEFVGAEGRSITVELLFDSYEQKDSAPVVAAVGTLAALASVIKPGSSEEKERRPHQCMVTWGTTLPKFKCVIESFSTKYTMFGTQGEPLRATCTVKLKEANAVEKKKK
jgi:Contractile injection system tube protein